MVLSVDLMFPLDFYMFFVNKSRKKEFLEFPFNLNFGWRRLLARAITTQQTLMQTTTKGMKSSRITETKSKLSPPLELAAQQHNNNGNNKFMRKFSRFRCWFTSLRLMLLLRYEAWKLLKFEYLLSIVNPHNLRFDELFCWCCWAQLTFLRTTQHFFFNIEIN